MTTDHAAGTVVLVREPWRATGRRFALRAGILAVGVAIAGIPGVWSGVEAWARIRPVGVVIALIGLAFVLFSAVNLARNRRAVLVAEPSGELVRPAAIQERLLRRERDWIGAVDVRVTEGMASVTQSASDPRVTLTTGERSIADVPLWGEDPEAFVERANALLAPRGGSLVLADSAPPSP